MTDIEQKALALVNDCGGKHTYLKREWNPRYEALCRAIEQHEAFKQEVSDALVMYSPENRNPALGRFIIAKTDPLVEAFDAVWPGIDRTMVIAIRAALEARGLKIREKEK